MIPWLERHNKISWTITILIAILIFYISSLTFPASLSPPGKIDLKPTLYHIIAFFLLALFLQISIVQGKKTNLIFLAVLIAILYGIFDEIHQLFVPGRQGSINDILLDSIGIMFALVLYTIAIKRSHTKVSFQ